MYNVDLQCSYLLIKVRQLNLKHFFYSAEDGHAKLVMILFLDTHLKAPIFPNGTNLNYNFEEYLFQVYSFETRNCSKYVQWPTQFCHINRV